MFSSVTNYLRYRYGLAAIRKAGIWYVDIPRTSSSSIRTELARNFGSVYGKSDLLESVFNVDQQVISSHLTAMEMRQRIGHRSWQNLFTFSFVRNPWDRMLSIFQYRQSVGELSPKTSYGAYLKLFFINPDNPDAPYHYHGYYYQAMDYLIDESGEIIVDFVGRFEDREKDLEFIREKCGCHDLGFLHTQGSSTNQDYRSGYNQETQDMVEKICSKDIEAFGYQF